jgi:CubicO group peptidase (beta-lactamase class C family)
VHLTVLLPGLSGLTVSHAPSDDPLRAELERRAWEECEKQHVPGVGVALVRAGRLAWATGFGLADVAAEREVTEDTVFNIGSISKTVAAWGLMKLVEEGKLALDSPVVTRRWQLPASEFDVQGVTLRRLLSHTAGLSLHGYPGFWPPKELPTLEASLGGDTNGAGAVVLESAPGTGWKYSGGGFTIAQLLLEETSGQGSPVHARPRARAARHATRLRLACGALAPSATPPTTSTVSPPRAAADLPELAAGLQTTPADLACFAIASLARSHEHEPPPVLKPETIAPMQTPAPAARYGLGYG